MRRSPAAVWPDYSPQGRHVHVLLIRGRTILERYFPADSDLQAAGAVFVNAGCELRWCDAAWDGVLLEDLRFPELAGLRSARMKPLLWYMDRVHRATCRSPLVGDQFYRVANFLDAPTKLFRPRVFADALFGGRGE